MRSALMRKLAERLPLPTGGIYDSITEKARPYYNDIGPNSWEHIQDVYSQAARILAATQDRKMSPVEYASIMFHDSSCKADPTKHRHEYYGGKNAVEALAGILKDEDLKAVKRAINEHESPGEGTTYASDLLASGDFNPPDPVWLLNKSYNWKARHGVDRVDDRIRQAIDTMAAKYGVGGTVKYPQPYVDYFGDRLIAAQKAISAYKRRPFADVKAALIAYRRAHGALTPDSNYMETSTVE